MTIYLYVKQHTLTGLKYFGKTESNNPYKYQGSGSYWSKHINKHGKKYIKTLEVWGFDNQELCTEFALNFSKKNEIINARDKNGKKIWANLRPEDGLRGAIKGCVHSETKRKISEAGKGKITSLETKIKISKALKFRSECFNWTERSYHKVTGNNHWLKRTNQLHPFKNKKHSNETKIKISEAKKGKKLTKQHREKISKSNFGKEMPTYTCPYCNHLGKGGGMKRWHFDNCSHRIL